MKNEAAKKFDVSCDPTHADIQELVEMIRKEFFGDMKIESRKKGEATFCDVLETNYYPLPFYSLGTLSTLCKKAGLSIKLEVKNQ